jgi:23S rRNA pseudouridine1911/1915/1917 synthase
MSGEAGGRGDAAVVAPHAARLDVVLHDARPDLSRRLLRRLIDDGAVRVNGFRVARGAHVRPGDRITLPPLVLAPEPDLPVRVVHEDARVVIVDKPGGMPGHALDPRQRGTLAAFLVARFPETAAVGDPLSSGLVHRLDTGTSGLQIAARTPEVFALCRTAFHAGEVTKRYLAIVAGVPPPRLVVDTPLAHDPRDRRRMTAATPGARAWPARTEIVRCTVAGERTLVEATIHTGVMHQVRVHLALGGYPVLGDGLYGGPAGGLPPTRHALHAAGIIPGGRVADLPSLESPLPAELATLLDGS